MCCAAQLGAAVTASRAVVAACSAATQLLSATVWARGTSSRSCAGRVQSRCRSCHAPGDLVCIILHKEIVRDQNEITGDYVTLN